MNQRHWTEDHEAVGQFLGEYFALCRKHGFALQTNEYFGWDLHQYDADDHAEYEDGMRSDIGDRIILSSENYRKKEQKTMSDEIEIEIAELTHTKKTVRLTFPMYTKDDGSHEYGDLMSYHKLERQKGTSNRFERTTIRISHTFGSSNRQVEVDCEIIPLEAIQLDPSRHLGLGHMSQSNKVEWDAAVDEVRLMLERIKEDKA